VAADTKTRRRHETPTNSSNINITKTLNLVPTAAAAANHHLVDSTIRPGSHTSRSNSSKNSVRFRSLPISSFFVVQRDRNETRPPYRFCGIQERNMDIATIQETGITRETAATNKRDGFFQSDREVEQSTIFGNPERT
jgi:hypothetical protein